MRARVIFVTVGTTHFPFDRLLQAVETLGEGEEIVVQYGSSKFRPRNAKCVELMDYSTVAAHMRRARVILSHAGVGSILTAALAGRRPIVVARRACLGEAVDDHQLELADALDDLGCVVHVRDLNQLCDMATQTGSPGFPLETRSPLREAVAEEARVALGLHSR